MMKKCFSLFLIATLLLVALLPLGSAFAYTGGLLHGKALRISTTSLASGGTGSTNSSMTDGNTTTGFNIGPKGGTSFVFYEFSNPQTISDYQIQSTTGYWLRFYDSNQTLISSTFMSVYNGTKTSITPVENVKYVQIDNTVTSGSMIYEFDVFGTGPVPFSGLFDGQSMFYGVDPNDKSNTTKVLTDGNTTNYLTLSGLNAGNDTFWYEFQKEMIINAYEILGAPTSNNVQLAFYDINNNLIANLININLSGTKTAVNYSKVKKIRVANSSSGSIQVNEFDLYGSVDPNPTIIKTDVTNVDILDITINSAKVTWSNPTGYVGIDYEGAKIYLNGALKSSIPSSSNSYNLENLQSNTNYSVKVVASYSDGSELSGVTKEFTTNHSTIANLDYTTDHKSITFTWDVPTDDPDYNGVSIYRDDVLLSTVDKTVNNYKDESLNYSTTYSYKFSSLYLDETEITGAPISVTTDPLPAEDVKEVKVSTDYNRVNLSWSLPEQDGFKHVNIYRKKIEDEPGFFESIFSLSGTKVYAAESDKIFETNGTYFNDLTVRPESEYEYTLTTQNEQGAESEGVTVMATTGEEPEPVLKDDGYTVDPNGDYIFKWTEPTTGTVKVLIDGTEYKTVDAALKQIVIPKEKMTYNAFGDPKVSLVPVSQYGKEGDKTTIGGGFLETIKLPFEVTDLLQTTMGIIGLVAPFILLTLVIYYFRPIKNMIVRAAIRLKKGEVKHE
jgi:hypothetical protein